MQTACTKNGGLIYFCFVTQSIFIWILFMNSLIRQFFSVECEKRDVFFHEIFFLNQQKSWDWKIARQHAPELPRSWFELSRISSADRVEFIRDLWLDLIPYRPKTHEAIADFFMCLEDVEIILHRQNAEEPFVAEMVYSLADNSSFFRGLPPATREELDALRSEMPSQLPRDFQAFCQIHNGFGKLSELGVLKVDEISEERRKIINSLLNAESLLMLGDEPVDPNSLIPFYESFGLASYQCFYADWYPEGEMGNVYLSGIDYTISDTADRNTWVENLAFPTFTEWLIYYLEGMSISL